MVEAPWERRLDRALRELLEELDRATWLAMTDALSGQSSGQMTDGMLGKSTAQVKAYLRSLIPDA